MLKLWLVLALGLASCGFIDYERLREPELTPERTTSGVRGFRMRLTLPGESIRAALANFPLFVGWPAKAELSEALGAALPQVFVTLANENTLLPSEIEHFDPNTGALAMWTLVPRLDVGRTLELDLYFDLSGSSRDTQVQELWSRAGIEGVWHLGEVAQGSEGEIKDSSAQVVHGQGGSGSTALLPEQAPSILGFGQRFKGDGGHIRFPSGQALAPRGSISHWIYVDTPGSVRIGYYESSGSGSDFDGFGTGATQAYEWHSAVGDDLSYLGLMWNENYPGVAQFNAQLWGSNLMFAGRWAHLAASWDGLDVRVFLDGVQVRNGTLPASQAASAIAKFRSLGTSKDAVGYAPARVRSWLGMIDELQISRLPRDPEWFRLSQANQRDPMLFFVLGDLVRVR